ncbi:hypothetical protein [Rhodococcus qingshengii]|uniref:hypothetical protein n=1 Tax=Rhodococcus qingshengii TaxID=334542 RepID=UPI001C5F1427|nr:hypothetical protein [Rhodococcus qingshengii]MBW4813328.1 hypothetical protein [Rhodococcus qingshengii]
MPPTRPSQAAVAAAYRTLIAHETEPKEQDFYRTRLQRLEQATESVCEFDCRSRVAAAGVGVYCPQCSAKCADTDLTTELAKAYRAAENAVAPIQCEWDQLPEDYQELGRVGIRGVLEFLTSADRLLADDEMRLTAEQVEDLKIVLGQLERGGPAFEAAHERLRALFPATEPAEERCQSVSIFRERRALVPGHDGRHAANGCAWGYPPAPAEPAEEETKAAGPCPGGGDMHPCVLPAGHAGVHADSRGLRWQNPASSPVVPATHIHLPASK